MSEKPRTAKQKAATQKWLDSMGKGKGPASSLTVKSSQPKLSKGGKSKQTSEWAGDNPSGMVAEKKKKIHAQICGQVDAFCPDAIGQKVAGGASGNSATMQERYLLQMGTDGNGNAATIITNSMAYAYANATTISAPGVPSVYGGVNPSPIYASLNTGGAGSSTVRVTSWGVRASYVGSDYNNQGVRYAGVIPASNYNALAAAVLGVGPAQIPYFEHNVDRLPAPLTYVAKPQSEMDKAMMTPVVPAGAGDDMSLPWDAGLLLLITGAAANANVLLVEVIVNYEVQIGVNANGTPSILNKIQNPVMPPSAAAGEAAAEVRSLAQTFYSFLTIPQVSASISAIVSGVVGRYGGKSLGILAGSATRHMLTQ